QVHLAAGLGHAPARHVDRHVAALDDRLAAATVAGAAQQRPQPRRQLVGAEGLGDVVVGARVERADLLALVADRAEDEDRQRAPAAQVAQHVDAGAVGQDQVEHERVGRAHGERVEGLGDGRGRVDLEPGAAQHDAQAAQDLRLVVDDEDTRIACHGAGSRTANAVPSSVPDCSVRRPPLASTKPLAMASPRPAPPPLWARPRKKGSKTFARWACGTPGPRSSTRTVTAPGPTPARTRTGSPSGENFIAFSTRLVIARSSWPA